MDFKDILSGFLRVHILHHAVERDIYGQWMINELAHHGYKISAGTLYPVLHAMETKGYLKSRSERDGKTVRRYYRATAKGRKALAVARRYLAELQFEAGDET
jgi:DNA-binding PadR family transcriptional regulator